MNIYFYAIVIIVFLYLMIKISGQKWRGFLIFSSVFWFIGLTMVAGGCKKLLGYREVTRTYNRTTARITEVRKYEVFDSDGNRSDEQDVSLSYTVNGQTYETVIKKANIYNSVGTEIDIYYSPENPEIIVSPDHVESKLSFILPTGVILCIIPFVLEIGGRILLKKQKTSAP